MGSIADVVGRKIVVVGSVSRCTCPVDRGRIGYQAGSRSRTVGGIGSWVVVWMVAGGKMICSSTAPFILYGPVEKEKKDVAVV